MGDGGSRTSVEGRSHSPARRSSLRSERTRAQLAARQKDSKDLPSLSLSAHAVRRPSAFGFYTDITTRKTNIVYNNNDLRRHQRHLEHRNRGGRTHAARAAMLRPARS